jgi:hypothetical protein
MSVPLIGESYRGTEGHSGFLLRQAWQAFGHAMDEALRAHGLSPAQYGALSVLAREPVSSRPSNATDSSSATLTQPTAASFKSI